MILNKIFTKLFLQIHQFMTELNSNRKIKRLKKMGLNIDISKR